MERAQLNKLPAGWETQSENCNTQPSVASSDVKMGDASGKEEGANGESDYYENHVATADQPGRIRSSDSMTGNSPPASPGLSQSPLLFAPQVKIGIMEDVMEVEKQENKKAPFDFGLQWSQWQLLDSILPTGGFAHSFGLEAATQARMVSHPEHLRMFVIHCLENTASLLLPFVHSATSSPSLETWRELNATLEATLTNEISRKASTVQGSALIRVAASVFSEIPFLKTIRDAVLASGTPFHHAPTFGLVCGILGMNSATSQRGYMFITMRDIISAATRLNLIGPLGAAVLQHQIASVAEDLCRKWMDRDVEDACQTAPLLDTVQGCHGYLFSKLFSS